MERDGWELDAGLFQQPATLSSPGSKSTSWSLPVPVPTSGAVYTVEAVAHGTNGLADISADSPTPARSKSAFTVAHLHGAPMLTTTQGVYVAPGGSIEVGGSGFGGGEHVAILLAKRPLAVATAQSGGGFSPVSVPIPTSASFGVTSLTAVGQTSGRTSSTPIDISNQWVSMANGSLNQSFEPNDQLLAEHVAASQATYLTQVWSYPSGAAIHTSPTVNKGILYFGNDAGKVTALEIHHSIPLWTYSASSPVVSTPAVASDEVIFGTEGESVIAVSAATGTKVWSRKMTSPIESSPQVTNGVVFVGSDDGTLYALSVSTGKVLWQVTLAGAIKGSPAVDPATHEVLVGDASGKITALNATNGSTLWHFSTVGAVTASPSLNDGTVYFGSGDGYVYALSEINGNQVWKYYTGAAVTAGGSVADRIRSDKGVGLRGRVQQR